MKNGYLTDVFGINSQLPQILKGFDIEVATFYRGIGDYPKAEFLWEGPDKSNIVVLKLDEERSYSNFYFTVEWPFEGREYEPGEIKERMQGLLRFMEPKANTRHYLMMDGVDHYGMERQLPWFMDIISGIDGVEIIHTNMDQYYAELKKDLPALEVIKGELRDPAYRGINNRVTKDILSSMVHLNKRMTSAKGFLQSGLSHFPALEKYWGWENIRKAL